MTSVKKFAKTFFLVCNIVLFLLAMMILLGFKSPNVIEAEKIILRDSKGNERLVLEGGDTPYIVMKNAEGKVLAKVDTLHEDGAAIYVQGQSGQRMQIQGGDRPGIFLIGAQETILANLTTDISGNALFVLCDKTQKPRVELRGGDVPTLRLYEDNQQVAAEFTLVPGKGSLLKMNDQNQGTRLQLQGGESPAFLIKNAEHEVVGSFFALQSGGAALGLGDSNGEVATFIRGGDEPNISLYQNSKEPNIAIGIAKQTPHILLAPSHGKEGILMHGGEPTTLLFINNEGSISLALSKHGIYQEKPKAPPQKAPDKKKKYLFSWEDMQKKIEEVAP